MTGKAQTTETTLEVKDIPCSVKARELDGVRVKLNIDPDSRGPRFVITHLTPDQAAMFRKGTRFNVTITPIAEE